jgi:hypothetical protein
VIVIRWLFNTAFSVTHIICHLVSCSPYEGHENKAVSLKGFVIATVAGSLEVNVQFHSFLSSARGGVSGQFHVPAILPPENVRSSHRNAFCVGILNFGIYGDVILLKIDL